MSFGPPTGKYVKTKRPVLRSQLDDDAEDALVSARARAIARGEGAMRKDRRERRLAAMKNEPNVMREVRAHPANHPPLRARARRRGFFPLTHHRVVASDERHVPDFKSAAGPAPVRDLIPALPTPASHPAPPLPAQNTHPIKVDKYGNYVRPDGAPREIQPPAVRRARRLDPARRSTDPGPPRRPPPAPSPDASAPEGTHRPRPPRRPSSRRPPRLPPFAVPNEGGASE